MRHFSRLKNTFCVTMWKRILYVTLTLAVGFLGGCSDHEYNKLHVGKLKGRLIIEWISRDSFRFIRHSTDPLRFTRFDGTTIIPDTMVTDGGSVPAALRSVKTYSPWGFGPAFVIHDWLFQMKSCKLPGYEKLTLESSADIMAEIIKTMMEAKDYGEPDKLTLYSMHQAVKSRFAKDMWDNGVCVQTPAGSAKYRRAMRSVPSSDGAAEPAEMQAPSEAPVVRRYRGKAAKTYRKKMAIVKKGLAAPSQFSFEHSYDY